jgi:two-component system sensor histidine kinase CpxA
MRSLALKIFLGFWAIHALIFLVLALLPDPNANRRLLDRVQNDGTLAATLYERRDAGVCSDFLAGVERSESAHVVLYSAALGPICRSSATSDEGLDRPVLSDAGRGGVVKTVSGREVCAMTVVGPSGRAYRIAFIATSHRPLDPWKPGLPVDFLVTAVLVSGVVCLLLARYLAAPLHRMREATHRLKAGDLGARAGFANRKDEIGDVVRDFDVMADRIQSLVQGQKQLLSDISHELRSPLARLGVALELARRTAGPRAEGHLARIDTEAGRMNDLIGRLLALGRDEQAESSARMVTFDLVDIVRQVAEDAQYEAGRAGRRVELSGEPHAPVYGDPVLAAGAIDNVVRNAIRYTSPDSPVQIRIASSAKSAQVVVRDHGPGVPDTELDRIFLPFYRMDASRDRGSGGIGLGLSIARRSVAVMGGAISAANADGGGLQVTISLPASP